MSPGPEKQRGFTLLEVLLAIALFAMLSLLTAQMLTTTIDSNEQTKKHQQRFSAIVRTVNLLDKDIRQRVPVTQLQGEKETLMLTTASSNSYPGACCVPDIQRVQWYLQDHTLYRTLWRYPEDATAAITQPMLNGVNTFTLRYYNGKEKAWTDTTTTPSPGAMEVTLKLADSGTITRLTLLPENRQPGEQQ